MSEAQRIHVVSAAIIRHEHSGDRILLAQRAPDTSFPLTWCTAGGKIEPGEMPAEALRRELREELGVELIAGALLGFAFTAELDPPVVRRPLSVVCYLVDAHLVVGTPVPGDKVAGLGWFNAADLRWLELAPADDAGREHLIRLAIAAQ